MNNEKKITNLVQAIETYADTILYDVSQADYDHAATNAQDLLDAYNELKELI